MKILKIITRNIMCFGNKTIEIDFNDEPAISELIGGNGAGKSTLIKIIRLGVYGKTDGLNLSEIANETNGNGYIETYFESKNERYKIIRTFSPHSVVLYEGDATAPTDKGGKPGLEKYILEQVIDIPYYVFDNVINLNLGDFKSFLTMKADDARKIRDRIFSFYVLNTMAELLKLNVSETNKQLDVINISIANINENIENSSNSYAEAEAKLVKNKETLLLSHTTKLEAVNAEISRLGAERQTISEKLSGEQSKLAYVHWLMLNNEFSTVESTIAQADSTIQKLTKNKTECDNLLTIYNNSIKVADNTRKKKEIEDAKIKLEANIANIEETTKQKEALELSIKNINSELQVELQKSKLITEIGYLLSVSSYLTSQLLDKENLTIESANLDVKKKDYDDKLIKVNEAILKYSTNVEIYRKRITAYECGVCPECGTNLQEQQDKKEEYQNELDNAISKNAEMQKLKITIEQAISSVTSKKNDVTVSIFGVVQNLKNKGAELQNYTVSPECAQIKSIIIGDVVALIKGTQTTVHDINSHVESIKPADNASTDRINHLNKNLADANSNIINIISTLSSQQGESIRLTSQVSTLNNSISADVVVDGIISEPVEKIEAMIRGVRTDILGLDNDIITSKSSKIVNSNKLIEISTKIANMKHNIVDVPGVTISDLLNIETSITGYMDDIKSFDEKTTIQRQELNEINAQINALNSLSNIEDQLQHLREMIDNHKKQLEVRNKDYEDSRQKLRYYSILEYTISDSGIKAYILKDIVPAINNEIANILSTIDIPLNVKFDDEFQPTVTRMGKKANLKSISLGQTKMIDFAILTAITKIIKMKYANLNVIFYDEIFSSIEAVNRTIILDIIHHIFCDKLKVHVWIVNHGHLPSSYFKQIIKVKSVNGFSELEVVDPNNIDIDSEVVKLELTQ